MVYDIFCSRCEINHFKKNLEIGNLNEKKIKYSKWALIEESLCNFT